MRLILRWCGDKMFEMTDFERNIFDKIKWDLLKIPPYKHSQYFKDAMHTPYPNIRCGVESELINFYLKQYGQLDIIEDNMIKIKIPFDNYNLHPHPWDTLDWIVNNVNGKWISKENNTYYFTNKKDASMFKLVFG